MSRLVLATRNAHKVVELRRILADAGLDGVEPRMDPVPALGEHTATVLRELGYTDEAIAGLRAQSAI